MSEEPRKAKPAAAKPVVPPPPAAPPPAVPPPYQRPKDDDDDASPYGVYQESEEEKRLAELNKPRFGDVADKFKKSARGPAQSILVLPVNLLIAEAAITGIVAIMMIIVGLWPLVFTDAPPSDEEYLEQFAFWIAPGIVALIWACLIAHGASKMQALESFAWALAGCVIGIFPLMAGIFGLLALRDPRVKAGFEEVEGAIDEDEDEDEPGKESDDDDEEDEEEDEDEDDRPRKRKKR